MKSALFTLAALLGLAFGTATLVPASATTTFAPYSENSGGGSG